MSRKNRRIKEITRGFQRIGKKLLSTINRQIVRLLRTVFSPHRQRDTANAGFVLPTVAMVSIVVILLTAAIVFRSFQRAQNASNVRVSEVVLQAATPAMDRAKAKLDQLFQDGRLPRATPTDDALYNTLANNLKEYTFGDETPLLLKSGTNNLKTAWRFPVDTDNNGKFDTYTLYGIYFRNPPIEGEEYTRPRNTIEARTLPMTVGTVSGDCGDTLGTSATLVGSSGWFKVGNKLKKAFFVYTANVPITEDNPPAPYETYKGNKGFTALEYQQDRVQLPLVNNAVVYEDDLAIHPGPPFRLNGRIFTNSNLLARNNTVTFYQVSSPASCFYDAENAKILVGGNVAIGTFFDDEDKQAPKVDLYRKGEGSGYSQTDLVKSVTATPRNTAYNSLAYVQRVNRLVEAQIAVDSTGDTDPQEVKDGITKTKEELGLTTFTADEEARIRRQELEKYFKKRTRRVPYTEIPFGDDALGDFASSSPLEGSGDTLRPPDAWIYPTSTSDGKTSTGFTELTLNTNGNKLVPAATEPDTLIDTYEGKEQYIGDRLLVGNNLPELWWNPDPDKEGFLGPNRTDTQEISGIVWDNADAGTRTRQTRVETLADLGSTDRDRNWELDAAKVPANLQDPVGGLRIVTGAGIYLPPGMDESTTDFSTAATNIWSDMMPVAAGADTAINTGSLPYLRMRATAVYHYQSTAYDPKNPNPIACVSSFYDPTNKTTARNQTGLADVSPVSLFASDKPGTNAGSSNNGISYAPPSAGLSDYQEILEYQAGLTYENGRSIDDGLLSRVITKLEAGNELTLSEKSRIDAALCALQILDGSIARDATVVPDGAILEAAFLDSRQIKAIEKDNTSTTERETFTVTASLGTNYDLAKQDRQPLEVRVTALDIDKLRKKTIGVASPAQEYLIPNSGIIYASRDDALPDLSAINAATTEARKLESAVDFRLDPTRRPNGILLFNGAKLFRGEDLVYRDEEKGLILATNLPAYVLGNFNLHTREEFEGSGKLNDDWTNFYERAAGDRDPDFACRPGDRRLPNCTAGDEWRPAAVLADSITLFSNNYRFGFRNEGNYDSNDNSGKNRSTGFNKYVTDWFYQGDNSRKWFYDIGDPGVTATTSPKYRLPKDFASQDANNPDDFDPTKPETYTGSSYFNNFVTPVQLVTRTREFATEVCTANCDNPQNWYISTSATCDAGVNQWKTSGGINASSQIMNQPLTSIKTGTAARLPDCNVFKEPGVQRRIAFKRDANGNLVYVNSKPVVYGFIKDTGNVGRFKEFPYDTWNTLKPGYPEENDNNSAGTNSTSYPVPWFVTQEPGGGESYNPDNPPLLTGGNAGSPAQRPVLQVDRPFGMKKVDGTIHNSGDPDNSKINPGQHNYWLQVAKETTFNLIAATGDTPARPTEDNGGLHNFVRFLENWNTASSVSTATKARISGAFMQIKRSAFASAPFDASLTGDLASNATGYPIGSLNKSPFYLAPNRQWGYDVALLSQSPDLFAQKLVTIPDDRPDEYYREVGRDDQWVKTLLCGKTIDKDTLAETGSYAVSSGQRPSDTDCEDI